MKPSQTHRGMDITDLLVVEEEPRKRSQKLKMIKKGLSAEEIGKELVRMDCKLDEIVELHDSLITKAYLEYCSEKDVTDFRLFGSYNILDLDLQHIRVLFDNGPERDLRKADFVHTLLKNICNYEKTEKGRDFLQTIADRRLFDEVCFDHVESFLMWYPKRMVEIIFKYSFHKIAKDMYDRDITCSLFANECENILSLLTGDDAIDVDKRHANGNTPLHIAVDHAARENIRWLLDKGADPNARNDEQHTPLSLALKNDNFKPDDCIKPFLLAGGNLVGVSHLFGDVSFFGFRPEDLTNEDSWQTFQLLIAQLCIDEAATVNADSLQAIERLFAFSFEHSNHKWKQFYDECRQQLKTLKKHEVCDSRHRDTHRTKVTIFSVIAEKPEIVARYISEEQLQSIGKFMATYEADTLNIYYRQLLKRRFEDIAIIFRGRSRAIEIVCQLTGVRDPNHLVVHEIVSYLNTRDFVHFNVTLEKTYE